MNRRWVLLGLTGLSCASLAVSACGDDTTNGTSPDAGADSTTGDAAGLDSAMAADTANAADTAKAADTAGGDSPGPLDASDATTCTVFDASGLDEASVQQGFQAVWKTYRCWSCHQKTSQMVDDAGGGIVLSGNNDGLGDSGTIFPPNLTNDPATGLGCWTNQQIEDAILNGADPDSPDGGGSLCPPMSKFGHALTLPDGAPRPGTPMDSGTAQQIIAFMRGLPVVNNPVAETMCPSPSEGGAPDGGVDSGDAAADAADGATD
jgi:hypothetical protein